MDLTSKKVLIVDDDENFVQIVEEYLSWKGCETHRAHDGKSALKKIESVLPEIVLLDLRLPDVSGMELVEKIRGKSEDIGIVIITGHGGEQVAVELMKAGALDFLSKPFEMEALYKSIENAIRLREANLEERQLERQSTLERFFPFLAHEIRNPLHAIGGALAIIERKSNLQDEALTQSIRIVKEEIQHLSDFVQECLDFVRPPTKGSRGEVNLNGVLAVALKVVSYMFKGFSERIEVVTHLDPQPPPIQANYEEIKQALINIIKNSCEAMPEKGILTLRTTSQSKGTKGWLEVMVKDNGSGIKKEDLPKIGSPFFTTKLKGSGLGMAICKKIIVERHGGKFSIDSEKGKGTTVIIRFPIG